MEYPATAKEVPSEVQWAIVIGMAHVPIGMEMLKKVNEVIAKYPEWFPWQTLFNSIPKSVYEAYLEDYDSQRNEIDIVVNALYPRKPVDSKMNLWEFCSNINDNWYINKLREKEYNKQKKKIWNKYYGKYNLKFQP